MQNLSYRSDLDGLRGLSVLFVLIFHFFPNYLKNGFLGVDIFFVLSGYLIAQITFQSLENGALNYWKFLERRILRLFPALIILFITCLMFGWLLLLPNEFAELGKYVGHGSLFISNWIYSAELGYFDQIQHGSILLHLWSLGVEMQFYLLWPLILIILQRSKHLLLIINILLLCCSIVLYFIISADELNFRFYSTPHRIWEIIIGTLLAQISTKVRFEHTSAKYKWHANIQHLLGLFLILVGIFNIDSNLMGNNINTIVVVVGACLVIHSTNLLNIQLTYIQKLLSIKVLRYVGLISYPLYLWHWSILTIYQQYKGKNISLQEKFLLIIFAFILSAIVYHFVEKPLKKLQFTTKFKAWSLLLLLIFCGLTGYLILKNNGFPSRFPPLVQQLSNHKFEEPKEYRKFTCFLEYNQDYSNFKKCIPNTSPTHKTLFLWGDSHAAHLYPGLIANLGSKYKIIQRTSAKCPPLIGEHYERYRYCHEINEKILEEISINQPDLVILSAHWSYFNFSSLEKTIYELKKITKSKIDLVGPVPFWSETLPKQLMQFARLNPKEPLTQRTWTGIDKHFMLVDQKLSEFAKLHGINYQSPKEVFCNEEGCLTLIDHTLEGITAWDYGHLTPKASQYLIQKLYE